MRHAVSGRKLNRTGEHRLAMRRNLVQSLFEHGEIRTTIPKAKDVRGFAERLVTLAIDGSLASRQRAIALLNDRAIIAKDHQEDYDKMSDAKRHQVLRARSGRRHRSATTKPGVKFTAESVIHKLFTDIGPKMKKRAEKVGAGGYTRIIKLADRRLGDGTQLAILQLVSTDDKPRAKSSDKTERKRRARVKYAFYAGKPLQRRAARRGSKAAKAEDAKPSKAAKPKAKAKAETPDAAEEQPPKEKETE
jgi:large subunit ribosomal protein L17